jgi:hypothetical protein
VTVTSRRFSAEQAAVPAINIARDINIITVATETLLTRPQGAELLYLIGVVTGTAWTIRVGDYRIRTVTVDDTTNILTLATGVEFEDGDGPYKMTAGTTLPTGTYNSGAGTFDGTTLVWMERITATTFYAHYTYTGAKEHSAGTRIDFTSNGTGTLSLPAGMPSGTAAATDGYASLTLSTTLVGLTNRIVCLAAPKKLTVLPVASQIIAYWWV